MMDDDPVLLERDGRVAHLVLNRPHRRNALTGPLADRLLERLGAITADDSVTAIVLRGAGGAFCSGLDLREFGADPRPEWVPRFGSTWRAVHESIFDAPQVVVAALERAAVNGGAALALAADFLVVGEEAFLQVGEVQQGMAAPMNLAWLTLRHPEAVVARVSLVGDRLAGPRLVELGLAFECVADDEVVGTADALARRLAAHDADGVRRIKAQLRTMSAHGASASTWFDRVTSSDPLAGRTIRPVAAREA